MARLRTIKCIKLSKKQKHTLEVDENRYINSWVFLDLVFLKEIQNLLKRFLFSKYTWLGPQLKD